LIVTQPVEGPARTQTAADMIDAIRVWEEETPTGIQADGSLAYEALVTFSRIVGQGTVFRSRELTGFYEKYSAPGHGLLGVYDTGVRLRADSGAGTSFEWPWADLRAVQTSSKSLQLNTRTDGLFDFRFDDDSPRRWEELMHRCLQDFYRPSHQRVREFQPRIVTVPLS
jgi:hypothetical protein